MGGDDVLAYRGEQSRVTDDISVHSCSACGAINSVSMDCIHGIMVCEECGSVAQMVGLVSSITFNQHGQREGVMVGAKDSGAQAGLKSMKSPEARKSVQRSRSYDAFIELARIMAVRANALELPQHVKDEALSYAERLSQRLRGAWKRDMVVSSAIYVAVRVNHIPLTLMDLTSVLSIDVFTIGRYYRKAVELLGVCIPQWDPRILLPRTIMQVLREYKGQTDWCSTPKKSLILRDAIEILEWIQSRDIRGVHPLTCMGAAVVVAMEMNQVRQFCSCTPRAVYSCCFLFLLEL